MILEDLGYTEDLKNYRKEEGLESFQIGKVISEHKERYLTICNAANVKPIIILNKIDLIDDNDLMPLWSLHRIANSKTAPTLARMDVQ